MLDALQNNLMDPEALSAFCDEYARERNRLQADASANRGSLERALATAKKDHSKLIDAIIAGVPADQVKGRMNALDAERLALEAKLSKEPAPSPIRIHPKMAETYREQVGVLIDQLQQPDGMLEAKEALRGLIDRIVLTPPPEGGKLSIHLEGALAALLSLALGAKTQKGLSDKTQAVDIVGELVLVAGVGFEPTTFRL